jgi:hypothetical protein
MSVQIFSHRTSTSEDWLEANPDGTVTYHWEADGWAMMKDGLNASDTVYSVEKAKVRWPDYANKIDAAVAIATGKSS